MPGPALPLPPPLKGDQPGTWAQSTILVRLPEIARRTLDGNDFPEKAIARLNALIDEIPLGPIRPIRDLGPDVPAWDAYLRPFLGKGWLEVPWFLVETYFYRRILEATGYFDPGETRGHDPFQYEKTRSLQASRAAIQSLSEGLQSWQKHSRAETLRRLLAINLWGNQADLSLWPVGEAAQQTRPANSTKEHILADDSPALISYLSGLPGEGRLDFLLDNAGFELLVDLLLSGYLLASGFADRVHLHCKSHPTFVSDALIKDVQGAIDTLAASSHPEVRATGQQLQSQFASGRLRLCDGYFWTSPLPFWEAPATLRAELSRSDLIISKGDANYRRLLGDRSWPFTTPFDQILSYSPAPLAAIRVFKAELAAGLSPEQIKSLSKKDPDWLTNGRWGVIQFARNAASPKSKP